MSSSDQKKSPLSAVRLRKETLTALDESKISFSQQQMGDDEESFSYLGIEDEDIDEDDEAAEAEAIELIQLQMR